VVNLAVIGEAATLPSFGAVPEIKAAWKPGESCVDPCAVGDDADRPIALKWAGSGRLLNLPASISSFKPVWGRFFRKEGTDAISPTLSRCAGQALLFIARQHYIRHQKLLPSDEETHTVLHQLHCLLLHLPQILELSAGSKLPQTSLPSICRSEPLIAALL